MFIFQRRISLAPNNAGEMQLTIPADGDDCFGNGSWARRSVCQITPPNGNFKLKIKRIPGRRKRNQRAPPVVALRPSLPPVNKLARPRCHRKLLLGFESALLQSSSLLFGDQPLPLKNFCRYGLVNIPFSCFWFPSIFTSSVVRKSSSVGTYLQVRLFILPAKLDTCITLSADVAMAKAKKAKNEEQRGGDNSNSEAVVKHQKLCVSIDMDNRRVYGYTELQIVIPDNGIVGLHADNLAIEKVTVDGEPAEFEVFPHYQHLDPKDRWCVVSSATSAADASGSVYLSSLEIELLPNLLIMCSKSTKTDKKQEENQQIDNGEPLSADASSYDLEFTVASNLVAVSSGTLLHQLKAEIWVSIADVYDRNHRVLTNDDPPRKTYVYKLDVPVAAQCISLAVAPFEILPDRHGGLLSHFCLPANLSKLRNTVVFFYNSFSHYEDYLSASFPFGSYKQVFIAPEMTVSSWNLGASIGIFSSHLLFDEKLIDQTIETRIKLAYALARQWFGVYITPEAPNDEWLLDGLAGFLTDSLIKRFLGNNEARYRRYKVAVLQMLEKQMGPESFRKFRHFANKIGNLERPFLKEFFPRWVGSCGCPVLNSDSPLLWLRADPEMEYLAEVNFNQPVQMWAFWRVRIQAAYALATTACEETDWAGLLHLINFYKSRRFDPNIGLPRPNDFHDFQEYFVLEYNDNNGNAYSDVFWLAALVQSVGELEFGQQFCKLSFFNLLEVMNFNASHLSIIYLPSLLKRLDRLLQFDRLMPSHNGILTISCIQSLTQMALKLSEFIPLDSVIELIKPYRMSKMWQIRVAASRALLELEFQCKGTDAALTMFIRYLNEESSLRGQSKLGVCALRLAQMTSRSACDNDVKSDTLVALLRLLESPLAFNNVILRHHIFCILQVLAGRAPTLYGVPRDETLRMGHTKTCSELKNIFAALIKQSKTPEPSSCAPDFPHNLLVPEGYMEGDGFLQNHELTKAVTTPALDTLLISAAQKGAHAPDDGPEQRNPVSHPPEDDLTMIPKVQMPAEVHEPIEQVTDFPGDTSIDAEYSRKADTMSDIHQEKRPVIDLIHDSLVTGEAPNEPDTVSNSRQLKKPKLKIRVKQSAASSRAEDPDKASSQAGDRDNPRVLNAQDGHNDVDRGASSSVSVDAPHRTFAETISTGNQNFEDANSCQDVGSRVTASIGSAKPTIDGEELVKELQCTADSSKVSLPLPPADHLPTSTVKINTEPQSSEQYLSSRGIRRHEVERSSGPTDPQFYGKEKEKKKDKDRKRKKNGHHDDPEHKELKRQKKEKKRKEKEMAKLLADKPNTVPPSLELPSHERRVAAANNLDAKPTVVESGSKQQVSGTRQDMVRGEGATSSSKELHKIHSTPVTNIGSVQPKPAEPGEANVVVNRTDGSVNAPQSATSHKIKIKFKNRTLGKK
ncbi:Transcription initiation factor TFIID subunit [Sesamum angolense]|uniref:Transcription initiation factor TFIID subunit 2 n=1 Tax=Sesamum angolense TaxID=2727404 RepID=A0AAE1WN93_9LAMI|nr:Transcription initiation factor TFIID subunit [Sesamum angolense]